MNTEIVRTTKGGCAIRKIKHNFHELKEAIDTINYFNKMDFNQFVDEMEHYVCDKYSKKDRDSFKFTGLSNVDFFKMGGIRSE
ncbi:MAG: hypothetical protein HOG49_28730 [Candidatus Scalindua sp.]|jgi:hypothetical protein|nr:hypothetical protein [Candidatus Scalindua sp.]